MKPARVSAPKGTTGSFRGARKEAASPGEGKVTVSRSCSATKHRSRGQNSSSIKPANVPWTPKRRRCQQERSVLVRCLAMAGVTAVVECEPGHSTSQRQLYLHPIPSCLNLFDKSSGHRNKSGHRRDLVRSLPSRSSQYCGEEQIKIMISSAQECLIKL